MAFIPVNDCTHEQNLPLGSHVGAPGQTVPVFGEQSADVIYISAVDQISGEQS